MKPAVPTELTVRRIKLLLFSLSCLVLATVVLFMLLSDRQILTAMQQPKGGTFIKREDFGEEDDRTGEGQLEMIPGSPNCTPEERKTHIAFLKVHKAGSTTLQNIFLRFAIGFNLTVILPENGNYFSSNAKFHRPILPINDSDHYDLLCTHSVFNYTTFSSLLPEDTVYIGIVRNPLDQFISAAYYYRDVYQLDYLKNIQGKFIENLILNNTAEKKDAFFSYTKNSMARDFGFETKHFMFKAEAFKHLQHIDDVFHLMLVSEYMDESLVLLRRTLGWSLKDILGISINVRGKNVFLNETVIEMFRMRNRLDYLVYDFFYARFREKLMQQNSEFYREVLHFRHTNKAVSRWCLGTGTGRFRVESSAWNDPFYVEDTDCTLMKMREFPLIDLAKEIHKHRYGNMLAHN